MPRIKPNTYLEELVKLSPMGAISKARELLINAITKEDELNQKERFIYQVSISVQHPISIVHVHFLTRDETFLCRMGTLDKISLNHTRLFLEMTGWMKYDMSDYVPEPEEIEVEITPNVWTVPEYLTYGDHNCDASVYNLANKLNRMTYPELVVRRMYELRNTKHNTYTRIHWNTTAYLYS